MSKYREVYIEDEKTLADSGNLTIDLNIADPISELQFRVKAKNGGTYNKNSPIARCVSKIEIVDGSDVLYSLDGMMAQAMSYFQTRIVPSMQRQAGPSENQEDHFILRFGRKLWDPDYALVPAKFRNPQIKLSWNLGAVNTVGATGFLTATGKLSIIARIMEGAGVSPSAFMMAKTHYDWTTAVSGDERTSLPKDHPWVLFLLRAWEQNTKLYSSITNLKLSIDQDKDIPFNLSSWDFLKMMENEYGKIMLDQHIFAGTEENIQTWLGVGETAVVTPETLPTDPTVLRAIPNVYGVDSGHLNLVARAVDGTTDRAEIHQLITVGQGLHHTFCYPFGDINDPDSWFDAPSVGEIKSIITQGNAGAAASISLLQARGY